MTIDGDMLIKALTLVVSVGGALYAWVMSQGKAHEPRLKELNDRIAASEAKATTLEARLFAIEGELKHMPDQDSVHNLELGLKDMQAQIATQGEIVKRVERTMERVEAFLDEQRRPVIAPARRGK